MLQSDPFACMSSIVLKAGPVYVIFSTQMWPVNQVSRFLGEMKHQEILSVMFFLKKSEF